uniref:HTH_48 domain-containing protein n=1 Tax=Haemonchus placei TaxID=6290 RepID=A0A0N4WYN3_HAEPC
MQLLLELGVLTQANVLTVSRYFRFTEAGREIGFRSWRNRIQIPTMRSSFTKRTLILNGNIDHWTARFFGFKRPDVIVQKSLRGSLEMIWRPLLHLPIIPLFRRG